MKLGGLQDAVSRSFRNGYASLGPVDKPSGRAIKHGTHKDLVCLSIQGLKHVNDPSAGSPTETLLRLLLPLNDQVWTSFRQFEATKAAKNASPEASLNHSIGSSDGRCVQRAGT